MKILFENNLPIPVRTYGGTERILYWLMKELVRLGHEVYLVGNPLSQVESIGVKLIPKSDPHNWKHLIPKDIDIVHFFVSPPFEYDGKFVVTIHDLILTKFPTVRASTLSPWVYKVKNLMYRLVIWSAVHRSKAVIAVSNFTKQDIEAQFSVQSSKVKMILIS